MIATLQLLINLLTYLDQSTFVQVCPVVLSLHLYFQPYNCQCGEILYIHSVDKSRRDWIVFSVALHYMWTASIFFYN